MIVAGYILNQKIWEKHGIIPEFLKNMTSCTKNKEGYAAVQAKIE